jgi:hypothetical protein
VALLRIRTFWDLTLDSCVSVWQRLEGMSETAHPKALRHIQENLNSLIMVQRHSLPCCHQYETKLKYLTILSVYPQYQFHRNLFINSEVIYIRIDGRKWHFLYAFNWRTMNSEKHKIVRLDLRFVWSSSYTGIIRTKIKFTQQILV